MDLENRNKKLGCECFQERDGQKVAVLKCPAMGQTNKMNIHLCLAVVRGSVGSGGEGEAIIGMAFKHHAERSRE